MSVVNLMLIHNGFDLKFRRIAKKILELSNYRPFVMTKQTINGVFLLYLCGGSGVICDDSYNSARTVAVIKIFSIFFSSPLKYMKPH